MSENDVVVDVFIRPRPELERIPLYQTIFPALHAAADRGPLRPQDVAEVFGAVMADMVAAAPVAWRADIARGVQETVTRHLREGARRPSERPT